MASRAIFPKPMKEYEPAYQLRLERDGEDESPRHNEYTVTRCESTCVRKILHSIMQKQPLVLGYKNAQIGRYYGLDQWLTSRLGRLGFLASVSLGPRRK